MTVNLLLITDNRHTVTPTHPTHESRLYVDIITIKVSDQTYNRYNATVVPRTTLTVQHPTSE